MVEEGNPTKVEIIELFEMFTQNFKRQVLVLVLGQKLRKFFVDLSEGETDAERVLAENRKLLTLLVISDIRSIVTL